MPDWTPKQIENAMLYGVCLFCGWPREAKTTLTKKTKDEIVYNHRICCTNTSCTESLAHTPSTGC